MNIIFHASAGTGKTYQVTNLYVSLVLGLPYAAEDAEGRKIALRKGKDAAAVDPRRILLMTFTDNAAAELRTRVTQLVLKARYEAESGGDADALERCVHALRALPSAPICTIHSFCAGYLRERALEAGLAPGFSVLDPSDANDLLDEAARAELIARLNPGAGSPDAPTYDADFAAFCHSARVFGGEHASGVVDVAQVLLRQAASRGVDLEEAEALLPPPVQTVRVEDFLEVLEAMKRVRSERRDGLPKTAAGVFQTLEKNLRDFPSLGKNAGGADNLPALLDALSNAGRLSFSGKGLKELSDRLKNLIEKGQQAELYRQHCDRIRAFARYAAAVARAYAARKRQLGVLDFDDLLTVTRDLLHRAGGDRHPAMDFDYIILDEAQDTSRVQCEIIEALWRPETNRLVICGDTKQSIYAWRNADPKVMPDLEDRIQATKKGRRVALRASYRSKDLILDFVNLLFARVYAEAYTGDERLIPAPRKNAVVRPEGERPCVELLQAPWERAAAENAPDDEEAGEDAEAPEIPGIEERVRQEMTAVAERLQLLVQGPEAWQPVFRFSDGEQFEKTGRDNAYRYADVLILLRRTSQQQVLEHVLRQYQIPYRIGGRGKGLFARPEVKDVLLLLKAVTHPFDTIALIGFLRSPWAGLSDESILRLGLQGDGFDEGVFRRNVRSPDGENLLADLFDGDQRARLGRARRMIERCRAHADTRLASEIVRDAIRETGYDAVLAGTFRGGQRLANLRKLIDWLRRTERGGTVLLADVVRLLEEYADDPPEIPEASLLDPEQNAVTIMTVHGAKGLTARVVFVPEICARPSGATPWTMLSEGGDQPLLEVKAEDLGRRKLLTPGFEEALKAAKDVREAESRNVFYVAMTRARDLVVLSGPCGSRKAAEWKEEVNRLVAEQPEAPELVRVIGYDELHAACGPAPQRAGAGAEADIPPAEAFEKISRLHAPPPPPARVLRFPATTLSAFHADPETFPGSALPAAGPVALGPVRPPDEAEASGADAPAIEDTDASGAAALFGTTGHAVLEELASLSWRGDLEALTRAAAEEFGLPADRVPDLAKRLADAAKQVAGIAGKAGTVEAEWPFAMALGGGDTAVIVDGTMDLLFETPEGWHIVDYKFTDDPPDRLVAKYGLQLNLYRLALLRRLGSSKKPIRTALLAVSGSGAQRIEVPPDANTERIAVEAAMKLDAAERENGR